MTFSTVKFPTMNAWATSEVSRIKSLSDIDLVTEVHNAINGSTYSWRTIHKQLQKNTTDYSLFREWSNLCDLKRDWESSPSVCQARRNGVRFHAELVISGLSARNLWKPHSYRGVLLDLKLLPIRAGFGTEAVQLMSKNMDDSRDFTVQDLWLDCEKWGLNYIDHEWVEADMDDEEAPLLGNDLERRNRGWHDWSWNKWF